MSFQPSKFGFGQSQSFGIDTKSSLQLRQPLRGQRRVTIRYGVFCVLRYASTCGFTTTDFLGWPCMDWQRLTFFCAHWPW